ncbi:uncharacterized protein Dsimw501_GD29600, partial [Drosophila simulans]
WSIWCPGARRYCYPQTPNSRRLRLIQTAHLLCRCVERFANHSKTEILNLNPLSNPHCTCHTYTHSRFAPESVSNSDHVVYRCTADRRRLSMRNLKKTLSQPDLLFHNLF